MLLIASLPLGAQDTFSRNDLDEEQRLAQAHLREARKEIDRSVNRVKASLVETALLTIFRADEDLSRAEAVLSFHPQHIEKLSRSLFYDVRKVRDQFRTSYDAIDADFAEVEKEFWVLVDEYDEVTGRTGARSLRTMLQRLDELRAIRDDETASAEERAAAAEALRNHEVLISRGDAEGALEAAETLVNGEAAGSGRPGGDRTGGGSDATMSLSNPREPWRDLAGAPENEWMQATLPDGRSVQARRSRECDVPGAPPACRDSYEVKYPDGTTTVYHDYEIDVAPDGTVMARNDSRTTYPDGSYDVISEERFFNPDTCELEVDRTVTKFDANGQKQGDQVVETAYYQDCSLDPRTNRRASLADIAQVRRGSLEVISPSGERRVYPLSGDEPVTERRGEYVGGRGMFLISEAEYTLSYARDDNGVITGVEETIGRQRNWEFQISEVPGSIAYNDDLTEMTAEFTLVDGKGKRGFEIESWEVRGPGGSVVAQGTDAPFEVRTSTSGQFEFTVRGQTDWGSDFSVTQLVNMNL
ncbi:MAG: hypothetical protein ACLFR7_01420 [Opitutales bacterium]